MSRKRAEETEEGANWMDTYGDMVTLLLTFFVLLFAMSSVDEGKYQMLVTALKGEFKTVEQVVIDNGDDKGDKIGNDKVPPTGKEDNIGTEQEKEVTEVKSFDDLYLYLKQYVEKNGMQADISLSKGDGYTYIEFSNNIFFDGDSAILRPEGKVILDVFTGAISGIIPEIREIDSHGHTAQEFKDRENSVEFDRILSGNRASNVIAYIQIKSKIEPLKLTSTGHGQYHPIVPHDGTEAARKKNRRVELVISEMGSNPPTLQEIYSIINGTKTESSESSKKNQSSTTGTSSTSSVSSNVIE